MRSIVSLIYVCLISYDLCAQGLVIQGGATISMNGAPNMVISNGDFSNSGNFVPGNSHLIFQGNQTSSIIGNSTTIFYQLSIDKSAAARVELSTDIQVNQNLNMLAGILDLNDQKLSLGTHFGQIVGENENNRITANTGVIEKSVVLNAPSAVNPGNLGAMITSSQDLGNTTIIRGHEKISNFIGETIQRYYIITPTNHSSLDATLRLYYLDAEYTSLNESALIMARSKDGGANWEEMTSSANNTSENWLEKDNLDVLTYWTIGLPSLALSADFHGFELKKIANGVLCSWAAISASQIQHFEIERSSDGINFESISQIESTSNEQMKYLFLDLNPLNGLAFYRLKMQLDQQILYSNIQSIWYTINESLKISPNPFVDDTSLKIQSQESTQVKWILSDAKGKVLEEKTTQLNRGLHHIPLNLENQTQGIYFLSIYGMSAVPQTYKLIKH